MRPPNSMNVMVLNKLRYLVDDLDKAKHIVETNMELVKTMLNEKSFPERWKLLSDHYWGEKITLANTIIDQLNANNELQ